MPDIILRCDNDFLRKQQPQAWDSEEEEEEQEEEDERKVPDVRRDDLASRRARMNRSPARGAHQFLPGACSRRDQERWEGIRRASQQAVLEKMERLEQEKKSEAEALSVDDEEVIITRTDNPFLSNLRRVERVPQEDEGVENQAAVPNPQKDDLARRRAKSSSLKGHRDPLLPLLQTSMNQSDMEKWQRLKLNTEASDGEPQSPEVAIITRKENPFLNPQRGERGEGEEEDEDEKKEKAGGQEEENSEVVPNIQKDDLARRRAQSGPVSHREPLQSLVQTSITQADMEKWQRLKMSTEDSAEMRSDHASTSSAYTSVRDIGRPLTVTEHEKLDELLAQYGQRAPEEEGEEAEEEEERQPDLRKDDMLARRTGTHQKSGAVQAFNRFLPMPGSKAQPQRENAQNGHTPRKEVVLVDGNRPKMEGYSEWNIKTARNWIGQRKESEKQEPKVSPPAVSTEMQRDLHVVPPVHAPTQRQGSVDRERGDDWDEEYEDDGPLPNLEKDDMHARRTGTYQKAAGGTGQPFLPVPGKAKHKSAPASGLRQPKDRDIARKCPQTTDREEAGSAEALGPLWEAAGADEPKSTPTAPGPPLQQGPATLQRRPSWLEDDDLPPIFSHRAASAADESESMSMFDMRCEEEAILQPHSQSRHELMHNQYNKQREEDDQWQDDLARWKNRRRSASQDLIKKENERKMMEKMMLEEQASALRRKSIKTYKEIVEEKERREQELHEAYTKARTPEEAANVLQRYALRFTISDAILERLQIPQPPKKEGPQPPSADTTKTTPTSTTTTTVRAADTPRPTSPPAVSQPKQPQRSPSPAKIAPTTKAAGEDAPKPKVPSQQQTRTMSPPFHLQSQPLSPEQSPTRAPPAPSKPVPLFTPKPYSQPKHNQSGHKPVKTDGLVRINGEMNAEDRKEITRLSSPPPQPPAPSANQDAAATAQGGAIAPPTSPPVSTKPPQEEPQPSSPQRDTNVGEAEEEERAAPTSPEKSRGGEQASADVTQSPGRVTEQKDLAAGGKRNCIVKTTIVTELTHTQVIDEVDATARTWMNSSASSVQTPEDQSVSSSEYSRTDSAQTSTLTSSSTTVPEGLDNPMECIETPILNLAKRVDHWTWDPNEERKRQERWQQEQERLLQEKYQREQEKLKQEWEKAQREVEEEEKRHYEEERRILEETMTPLTSRHGSGGLANPASSPPPPQDSVVPSLSDCLDRKQAQEKQAESGAHTNTHNGVDHTDRLAQTTASAQQNGKVPSPLDHSESATPHLQFIQDGSWKSSPSDKKPQSGEWKKTASLDRNFSPPQNYTAGMRRSGSYENVLGTHSSTPSPTSPDTQPPSPSRSVSGKKLCSSCAQPLGKGAAMIIETLGLYFHIQCFKCGVCKGLLGDTSTGTDVRIRNGLLNCQECYIKSRAAGQPTTL